MIKARSSMILVAALLGGCATADGRPVERTVFNNPFGSAALARTGIGPQCEVALGRDSTCLDPRFIVARRGRIATLRNGETVRLTRAQVETLRIRAELLRQASHSPPDQTTPEPPAPPPPPPPPPEPTLPTASDASDMP